jgi:hypothetical protein
MFRWTLLARYGTRVDELVVGSNAATVEELSAAARAAAKLRQRDV